MLSKVWLNLQKTQMEQKRITEQKGKSEKKKRILKVFGIILLREQKACDRVENDSVSGGFISFPINVRYLVPNI